MIISSSNNMFLSYQHSQSDIKTHTYASKSNFYLNFGQIWENYLNSMLLKGAGPRISDQGNRVRVPM